MLIRTLIAACLFLAVRPTALAQAPVKTSASPDAVAVEFYKWYLHGLSQNKEPVDDEAAMSRYVSPSLVQSVKRMYASGHLDSDYFIRAQDYLEDWEANVVASHAAMEGARATTVVTLGATPKTFHRLTVTLTREGDGWKISKVGPNLRR
jgi:hypothetical protein